MNRLYKRKFRICYVMCVSYHAMLYPVSSYSYSSLAQFTGNGRVFVHHFGKKVILSVKSVVAGMEKREYNCSIC